MASRKQIEANRKNAQSCTGPTSPEGKAISSQNALKTGIDAKSEVIRVESQEEFDELIAEFYARYHPTVPEERTLVDALIRSEWLSRRYACTEKSVWERGFNATKSMSLGLVYEQNDGFFDRLGRHINSAHRNFRQTLKQLREIQAERLAEPDIATLPAPMAAEIVAADPETIVPDPEPAVDALPSRDCEGAAPEIHNPNATTELLNPKLVSFLTPASPPDTTPLNTPETRATKEDIPPVAA